MEIDVRALELLPGDEAGLGFQPICTQSCKRSCLVSCAVTS